MIGAPAALNSGEPRIVFSAHLRQACRRFPIREDKNI